MEAGHTTPGLNRHERDAITALGAFLLGMLVLLCTTILALHLLSGLPEVLVYGIMFAVMVFAVVCGSAFLKADIPARRSGPPQVQFRVPVRRRRRAPASKPRPLP